MSKRTAQAGAEVPYPMSISPETSVFLKDIEKVARDTVEKLLRGIIIPPDAEFLNTPQAARYLGVSEQYLEIARYRTTGGPDYIKLPRAVRYKRSDLDAWMVRQRVKAA
jgi:predicted DNA-binding transcriptional regulator AlpA